MDETESVADRLRAARTNAGFASVKDAAAALGMKYQTYAAHENGNRAALQEDLAKYARRYHVSIDWLVTGKGVKDAIREVKLVGKVGAGAEIYALEDDHETVEAPANANKDTVAVAVEGDSMFPAYEDGTLLYYSRFLPPQELLNKRCVVKLASERIYVKILRKGSIENLWTLQSLNPLYPDIENQSLEWVAPIDWIRPR